MDILVSFTAEVAKYTVAPIGRQAGYLLFYKGNFKKLADRVIDLEGARERVNRSVEEEKRNGKEIYMEVVNWLEKVNELIEKANQLQIDPRQANVGCSRWSFPNLIWRRHQLSRNAAKITKDVVEAKGKEFNGIGYLPDLPDGVPSSSATRVGEKLGTRESLKENIVKALKDPNARNIGVYGLSGVGKTTLVKEIARIAKQDKLFDKVIIAYLSRTSEIETIQVAIAERLGLTFSEVTVVGRADRLRQRIKKEKTILVILDDIWTRLELEEVGIPSSDEHNGYKLLMTSRKKDVLLQMDAQKDFTFRLELLNEAETWSLFQSMVGDVVKDDIRLQSIATQVAQKCGGLPLGIATVARALRNKDIYAWKDALRQLENVANAEMDARIYSVLELSYNWLESDEMRALFLLSAVLPDNRAEYCLKVAMGLDTFKHINTVDDARNRFQKIIGSLKASCLLLEGNSSGWIQMHDSVREVAISIASRDTNVFMVKPKVELEKWPTNDFLRKCSQIILDWCQIHELPQSLDCPNVKFFCLNSANRSLEIPDTIFEGMGNLRVLDLSDLNLSLLPTSFRFLTALQTLCLFKCVLENMNAIEALKNLEFLSFWECSMNKLPSEIGKLTQLRMLDLSHSGIEVIPPNIISSLTKLEELYMGNASIKWEDEISANQNENASLIELQQLSNLTALELQIREAWILPRDLQLMFEKLERYKIAIGDVWDWSDIKDKTLKTLMLKLGTNIHLEHGIKALIKGVENLYLDEVEGIQNVLYQLNWEGFPWLKHLHIQNNAKMKHIVDSTERNQDRDSFPKLETLILLNLRNLEQICHGPLAANSFGKLSVIKVKNCVQLKYLLSFSMVKGLSQLSEIEVCQCNSMKKIVLGDINSSADNNIPNEKVEFLYLRSLTLEHLQTLDNFFSYELTSSINERVDTSVSAPLISAQVAFPNLDTLKLSSLNLNKIWDDIQHSMDKLTNLIVENCDGLKYLFSSTVVRSFKNLKHLEISNCPMMEEIIAIEERNDGISALEEVGFFKLEKIILKDMKNLKTIWHRQFKNLKTLQVNNCEKIVVVFPSSMQKAYNNLEMLEVGDCALVEKIFELTSADQSSVEDRSHLKGITLHGLPKLKKIWSRDPQGILSFGNLEIVHLNKCGSLEHLFPFSIATCCSHLMELRIKYCGNMKEIVAESVNTTPRFEFDKLNTLLLWGLYKLKSFYAGNHILKCPSLRTIDVSMCAKLNLYKTVSTISPETTRDGKLPVLMQQAFIVEEVIPNLEKLRINQRDANVILQAQNLGALFTKLTFLGLSGYKNEEAAFPYWFLQNVRTLEHLVVEFSSFKKIFQDEILASEEIHTQLKKLYLHHLPKLQHICEEGSQIDPVLELLEYLQVVNCPGLTNLLPSSVTFNHLLYLKITNCNGMINLITSRVAQSLVNLIMMKVKDCNSLEEVIIGEENVDIAFISLQILMLECLSSLNKFCSSKCFLKFPLLAEVVVRECPRMKIFSEGNASTPNLRKVKIAVNDEEWHWKENLNDTITSMFNDKVAFGSYQHLKLSEYPELKELWYGQLQHNVFRSLKYLVVHNCDFLSDVLFQPNVREVLMNLEELDISDCSSLEAVFDLKGKFAEEILARSSTQLKKLTLSDLPKLKHVWKEDAHNTLRFQSLSEVSVTRCESLISLFPLSVARDILDLQNLQVNQCGIKEIVAKEEGMVEKVIFVFPCLISIGLIYLPKLKAFFAGIHSLQCKSLKTINVFSCPKLEQFMTKSMRHQERARNDKLNVATYQPLFNIEEVLANVENLTLNEKDFDIILQSQYSRVQFSKVKLIKVSKCTTEEATFPYWFLKNVPCLETLVVQWSSFIEIFQGEGNIGEERETKFSTPLRNLTLWQLHKLQHICKEGLQMDPVLQLLETIYVQHCSSLIKLVPSSVTFTSLTYLEVTNCNGLINLITCSTAKSLVKLTTMKIKLCDLLEDVVNGKEDETNNEIAFYNLQSLELVSLPRLCRFCSCMCPTMFPLLEEVVVKECPRMEIFSLGETSTPNLQNVQTEENDEGYGWEGDLNGTIKKLFEDKVAFCHFEHLTMSNYPELKDLWYGQLHHSVFCNLKSLVVQGCDFLSHVLFPLNVLQVLRGLEDLEVRDCDSLETVFDVKDMKSKETLIKQNTQLKRMTLSSLPKLKHIWNEDPCEIISFGNLCMVDIFMCESLLNVFPLSLCEDLGHLDVLEIVFCGVEEIVAVEEGSMKCSFNFPQLTKLVLQRLINLKSFYPGKHTLECPSLKILDVYLCEALTMFSFNHLDFQQQRGSMDENHDMLFRQALFSIEKLSPNLEQLAINGTDALRLLSGYHQGNTFHKIEFLRLQCFDETPTIFLNDFHAIFPSLETLEVRNSSFETLFPTKGTIDHLSMQISKQVRNLYLFEMEKLMYIWDEEFPSDHLVPQDLEHLVVRNCPSLINLAPSSTSFTNLTYLIVDNCKELVYLLTSSTAKSLVQLTTFIISNCEKMLDVVKIEEEKAEEDIIFENLEYLEFTSLSSVRSFCYGKHTFMFPSLLCFVVKGCPRMKIFSSGVTMAPFLTAIEMENQKMRWKDDLNTTIEQLFIEKVAFGGYQHLKLSEYPELKELWYGQLQHNVFRSLKYLVVHKCDFLSDVLFQPNVLEVLMNLEELDISHCNSLEAVFDLKGQFAEEILARSSTQLKKLTLSDLPKLKHVWKEDPHNALRFQSLSEVSVATCKSLISLFPLSVARDILGLQNLQVYDCGIEEIVAKEEGMEEIIIFVFPRLISIGLRYLPKLKAFFAGIHSLQCTSLKTVNVFSCPKLEQFMTEPMRHQERARNDKINVATYQPLFKIEEVLANVENLTLNEKDFDIILRSQYSGVQFSKVKLIKVSKFTTEEAAFPYWFLKNVPCLETLVVEWSSFTEIFQGEGSIGEERETKISTPLRKLALGHLHKLQHICKEGHQMDPVLQLLETIYVQHCSSLIKLVPSSVTFTCLTYLEVTNCNGLINLITCSTAKSLVKLTTMKIKLCNLLEDVVNGKEDETNNEIAFCNLQSLELVSLPRLCRFCSCMCPTMFPLLEVVVVEECPRMEIFSLGETSTPNLQNVQTEENDEGYGWEGDLNGTIKKLFEDKVAFGSYQHLKLSEYPELKELWYGQFQHNVFRSLKYLVVHKCDFLSDVLFQPNVLEVLMNLEELDISHCNSLEAVFDLKGQFAEEILVRSSTQLKKLTLSDLPKLKHVWKEDPHNALRFQSLSEVSVATCKSLISLFPLSVARDILGLQNLQVYDCGIEEIVAKEEGMEEIIIFVFPRLISIGLRYLPKLKAFFAGIHSLQCTSLKTVNVFSCPKLEQFMTEPMRHQERARNDKLNVATYQPLFKIEEVLANVENLTLNEKDFDIILRSQYSGVQFSKVKLIKVSKFTTEEAAFPYWFLKNVPCLETLVVEWSSFTEIFQGEGSIGEERETKFSTPLRKLTLHYLHKLQHICKEGHQMDPVLQLLETIYVQHCSSLIKLVPSSVTFTCLTYLEVTNCNGLINLITCSTAKSLVKLTTMKIKLCNLLEDVVNGKEDETNNEIAFCNLQSLELVSLPRLCRFCSCMCPTMFPLLEVVVVEECPRMEIFSLGETSTPNLQNVQTEENDEGYGWEGDLNGTIKKLFEDKVAFCKFKCLTLSEYPELKDPWYGQLHDNVFCNLKSLVVQRCDFLSDILFPSNILQVLHGLEDLVVRDCDSLETVFDVKGMMSKEILIKQSTQLKRLTLSSLPKLKQIWNEDPYEIISFGNLCMVDVSMCESLLNVFPLSLCEDLGHLEVLEIESCGVEEIVAMEKGSMKCSLNFPQLTELALRLLTNLKSFYPEKHTLECPSLKILNVYRCEALTMFSFTHLDFQQPDPVDENHDMLFQQALFSIEKLNPNLEQLAINGTDALRLLSGYHQGNTFHKIEFLCLQCFDETPTIFLNDFHAIFPSLETLEVRNSSFETLFPTKGTIDHLSMQISKQVRNLWLFELEKLKYIWQEDFPLDHPLLHDLEDLDVCDCPSLISLVPSSTTFTNLTSLTVGNCKELIYLMTSSTAKSLVKLTTLEISNCEKMLDVVKIDEERAGEDIIFENLEYMEFTSLSSLRSFCYGKHTFKFPSLLRFVVKGCPQMKVFSSGVTVAPFLTAIEMENEKMRWKDDLNTTIEQLFIEQQELPHSNDK